MKHTPGPWRLDRARALIPLDKHTWAEAYGGTEANARLIAASPELLDALEAMLSHTAELDPMQGYWPEKDVSAVKQARAAIAKATGTQE